MSRHGGDIYDKKVDLDFSSNLNPFGMPDKVQAAAITGVERSACYPDPDCRQLRAVIAGRHHLKSRQVLCGNGAAELIYALVQAVKPQRALVPAPTFSEYEQALSVVGSGIKYYYLKEAEGFRLDERFTRQITPELDIVFLCNPNNPTGIPISGYLMEQILEKCEQCEVLLVVDECFIDFLDEPEQHTLEQKVHTSEYLVLLKAFTKLYAMAGLRLGYLLSGNQSLLGKVRGQVQPWNVSLPAQLAGVAAVEEREYVNRTREYIKTERAYVKERMEQIGLHVFDSQANYLLLRSDKQLRECCLKAGLLLRDCSNFKGLESGYYRIAVKLRQDNDVLLNVLEKIVKEEVYNGKSIDDPRHDVRSRKESADGRTVPHF